MKQKLLFCFLLCFALFGAAFAQERTVSGKVKDPETGEGIPGVSVYVKGTSTGTTTDVNGDYKITVPNGATLVFQGVGYANAEVAVGEQSVIDFTLALDTKALGEVVITALGISREERSLGYAVQKVKGEDLASVGQQNFVNALSGRVAGVQIIGSSGAALGGSQKIRLRGVTSLGSNDSPLIVVDGTPIDNSTTAAGDWRGGRDYGNLAGDINPNDIERLDVLKGPSAAALYGQRGANGVIMITTKKGSSRKGIGVDFNHNTTFERVYVLPEYQNEYGGGYDQDFIPFEFDPARHPASWSSFDGQPTLNYQADESWGPKLDGRLVREWFSWYPGEDFGKLTPLLPNPDNVRNFFDTGSTITNNISFNGGTDKSSFRLSLGLIDTKGVMPGSKLTRNNFGFNGSSKLSNKLTVNTNINYVFTKAHGRPASGYTSQSAITSMNQWFHRQLDIEKLRNYKNPDGTFRAWNILGPNEYDPTNTNEWLTPLYWNNPFFEAYENAGDDKRERVYGNIGVTYEVLKGLTLSGFIRTDFYSQLIEEREATGGLNLDSYSNNVRRGRENNFEFLAQYQKNIKDISINATLGGNIRRNLFTQSYQGTAGGLSTPNLYNISASVDRPVTQTYQRENEVRSVYGSISLGYKNYLFLDLTGRNDISSTLPRDNNSYLYYSVSSSFVFSEIVNLKWLSFGKVKASIAQVGSDTSPYGVFPVYGVGNPYGSTPTLDLPNTLPNDKLKPQLSTNYEVGLEARFVNNRVGFDVTYYSNPIKDQILSIAVAGASGYSNALINAGNITRQGIEIALTGTPVKSQNFMWDVSFNIAKNTSTVKELYTNAETGLSLSNIRIGGDDGASWGGSSLNATVGEQWGNIRGRAFARYQAKDANGNPIADPNNGKMIISATGGFTAANNTNFGTVLPDWTGGLQNTFTYKNWQLSALIDFQVGGQFFSTTKMFNAYSGLGIETVASNDKGNPIRDAVADGGGVRVDGVSATGETRTVYVEAQTYYARLFGYAERWLYDASYIKLREVRLGYSLPKSWIEKTPFQNISLAVIVRNAWLIKTNVPGIDPSEISSGANAVGWTEGGTLPGVRSIGFDIRLGL